MNRKRVLIITYYWPPAGGGGVQRWLKFSRYLPEFGWDPVVYTPENADYPVIDDSLMAEVLPGTEVIRTPIFEPYRAFRKLSPSKEKEIAAGFIRKGTKESVASRMVTWLRGNLVIPDARRFWIGPSVRFLVDYLRSHPVDAIVSTGPPHSMHLIARAVSAKTGIPWLADFRDPWVNMDNADKFRMSAAARTLHERLERSVLRSATEVVTVSWYLSQQYAAIRGSHVGVITNGYDHADVQDLQRIPTGRFTIGHYGTFGDDRNPPALWQALEELCSAIPGFRDELRLELVGPTDAAVLEAVKGSSFASSLAYIPYLKHDQVLQHMKDADVLLVILNQNTNEEGRVTGKIFEYIAMGNQVLGIGSVTSDCARVIRESGTGAMIGFSDKEALRTWIADAYSSRGRNSITRSGVERFTRRSLTQDLVAVLEKMSVQPRS